MSETNTRPVAANAAGAVPKSVPAKAASKAAVRTVFPETAKAAGKKTKKINTGLAAVFTAVLFVFLDVAAVSLVYFNIGGLGYKTMSILQKNDSVHAAQQASLNSERTTLNKKTAELSDKDKSLAKRESEVQKKETELAQKEQTLKQSQDEADKLKNDLTAQLNDIQDLVDLYISMDAKKAAELLVTQGNDDLAIRVLKAMKSNDAATILSSMDSNKAAALMAKMIK